MKEELSAQPEKAVGSWYEDLKFVQRVLESYAPDQDRLSALEAVRRVRKGLHRAAVPVQEQCWCTTCQPITMSDMRFVVCPDCGNKRCPKAHNHANSCTGSNEPGQAGSSWANVAPVKPLTDDQTRMLNFLYGAGELDGVWFGEHHPTAKGEFWWREHLRRVFHNAI
ncbi:MAG: hypothetical protein WC829_09895 [Hyphomicrobium sp.]|jgi:hypothetical protein